MAASSGTDRVEPNLTPLLDVVLQLIMFFMITVNFVSEQVNQNVRLPSSSSAQELMAKGDIDVLVINVEVVRQDRKDAGGQVVRDSFGKPIREMVQPKTTKIIFAGLEDIIFREGNELLGLNQAQRALADLARQLKVNQARREGKPIEQIMLKTTVVIRADSDTHFGLVFPLMAQCNREGFAKVGVRAETKAQPNKRS